MDFDDVLKIIGDFGKYQKRFYLMVALPAMFKGFQVMMVVFTVFVPKHRCAIPGLDNDTFEITSEAHRDLVNDYIPILPRSSDGEPEYDKCKIYLDVNTSLIPSDNMTRQVGKCDRWVYDQSEFGATLITKFDLVCDRKEFRAHSNMMMMAGFLMGSLIASILCDWIGRKLVYCCCLVLMMIFGIISAFPPSSEVLLAYRFMGGLGLMGVMVSGFVLAVEMIGPSRRTMLGAAWQIVWLIGPFIVGALSYILRDWQQLQLCGAVPPVIFILYWWLVPESPRWLVTKGRVSEAMVTIRKAAKVNGVALPVSVEGKLQEASATTRDTPSVGAAQIIKYPVLVIRTLIVCFNWCVISMTYYGLSLNVSNLGGSVRVNFLLSSIVELLGYSCAVFLLDRLGRKKLHTSSMLIAGIACLLTIFTVTFAGPDLQWITTALAMIGKLGVSSSFAIIFLYSAELYPTVMRNFGVGGGSMFARIGSMVSPYIADLAIYFEGPISKAIPLIVFGALAVAAGLFSICLPETLHRKLPETLEDAVHFGKKDKTSLDTEMNPFSKVEADDTSDRLHKDSNKNEMGDSLISNDHNMKEGN